MVLRVLELKGAMGGRIGGDILEGGRGGPGPVGRVLGLFAKFFQAVFGKGHKMAAPQGGARHQARQFKKRYPEDKKNYPEDTIF